MHTREQPSRPTARATSLLNGENFGSMAEAEKLQRENERLTSLNMSLKAQAEAEQKHSGEVYFPKPRDRSTVLNILAEKGAHAHTRYWADARET